MGALSQPLNPNPAHNRGQAGPLRVRFATAAPHRPPTPQPMSQVPPPLALPSDGSSGALSEYAPRRGAPPRFVARLPPLAASMVMMLLLLLLLIMMRMRMLVVVEMVTIKPLLFCAIQTQFFVRATVPSRPRTVQLRTHTSKRGLTLPGRTLAFSVASVEPGIPPSTVTKIC